MKKLNKKGFTLVELLAVIVILAVVMIIAATAMGSVISDTTRSSFAKEGMMAIDAAKYAFQVEQLKPSSGITATKNICMDIEWLNTKGYYSKGSAEGYKGAVLITYSSGKYEQHVWLSNGTYLITNQTSTSLYDNYETSTTESASDAADDCGGSTNYDIKCSVVSGTAKCQ